MTTPEDEVDVPEPTEPVFVSPTSTAAGRAAEDTERPFSAESEYTVLECELKCSTRPTGRDSVKRNGSG